MSLTSYRAAPPRDKPLRALREPVTIRGFPTRLSAPNIPSVRLPEKATRGLKPVGCEGVCTNAGLLWKGSRRRFFRFCDKRPRPNPPTDDPSQNYRKG